jgi:hypothetical protein
LTPFSLGFTSSWTNVILAREPLLGMLYLPITLGMGKAWFRQDSKFALDNQISCLKVSGDRP